MKVRKSIGNLREILNLNETILIEEYRIKLTIFFIVDVNGIRLGNLNLRMKINTNAVVNIILLQYFKGSYLHHQA